MQAEARSSPLGIARLLKPASLEAGAHNVQKAYFCMWAEQVGPHMLAFLLRWHKISVINLGPRTAHLANVVPFPSAPAGRGAGRPCIRLFEYSYIYLNTHVFRWRWMMVKLN